MPGDLQRLAEAKFYVVLDRDVLNDEDLFDVMKKTVRAGADVVQLRHKNGSAREIFGFCQKALRLTRGKIPFIVNDRLDIALACGADGVHLGQDDLPMVEARRIAGRRLMIGASCQTRAQARTAARDGADYIGFGSVFKTPTKPQRSDMDLALLKTVLSEATIPVFPIGGIGLENIRRVLKQGADRVAVTRSVCLADDVVSVTKEFSRLLKARPAVV